MELNYYNIDYEEFNHELGKQKIWIQYTDNIVDIESRVKMVDFNTFVSGVGGALGLFLGFSIIDSLLYLYNIILGWKK